jgi:hypothetical protein
MTCLRCEEHARVGGCLDHRLQRGEVSFQVNADLLYNFVHPNLGSKPIQIHSKRQWKRILKEKGLTDDVPSKGTMTDIRKRPFDRKWDVEVTESIKKSIAEVKKKPFNALGKNMTYSQIKDTLRKDLIRQKTKKEKQIA